MPENALSSCWYMVKKARKEVTLAPWRVFLPEMLLHRQGHHTMGGALPIPVYYPFFSMYPI